MNVMFSILSYYPSFITSESINLGILFHDVDNDIRYFETTSNWERVSRFDDEVDIDYLKLILDGIKEEIRNDNLFNYKEKFNLKKYSKFYVNELKFSEVTYTEVDNMKEFILETKKMFLKYDFSKKDRPDYKQQIRYIKGILKHNKIKYSAMSLQGEYNESVTYDYVINEYAFKLFTFENRRLSYLISTAKTWSYNAMEMKDKFKTIFIYDKKFEDENFDIVMNILRKYAYKIMKIDEALEFIFNLNQESEVTDIEASVGFQNI